METEIEVKFADVNLEAVRKKLLNLGAECEQKMTDIKRAVIDYDDKRLQKDGAFIRVRDEGNKITLTYKKHVAQHLGGAKEIETTVKDFDKTIKVFEAIGLEVKSYQENQRETWRYKGGEIVIDIWPWINPYIEVEASSKTLVKEISKDLGFSWEEAIFGDVMVVYRHQYPKLITDEMTIGSIKSVKFSDPFPYAKE